LPGLEDPVVKLLHVVGSPMEERSYSRRVAEAFLAAWSATHPEGEVETLDLWRADLPVFDKLGSAGKFKTSRGLPHTEAEAAAWTGIEAVARHFAGFDRWVVSCGMWNFGMPYRLKHYVDLVVQPRVSFDPGAGKGMLGGRPMQLVLASGGRYEDGSPADFLLPHLRAIYGSVGTPAVRVLRVMGTGSAPEKAEAALTEALAGARAAAAEF
jgi:FMN-dependent NADH-azoreductase